MEGRDTRGDCRRGARRRICGAGGHRRYPTPGVVPLRAGLSGGRYAIYLLVGVLVGCRITETDLGVRWPCGHPTTGGATWASPGGHEAALVGDPVAASDTPTHAGSEGRCRTPNARSSHEGSPGGWRPSSSDLGVRWPRGHTTTGGATWASPGGHEAALVGDPVAVSDTPTHAGSEGRCRTPNARSEPRGLAGGVAAVIIVVPVGIPCHWGRSDGAS